MMKFLNFFGVGLKAPLTFIATGLAVMIVRGVLSLSPVWEGYAGTVARLLFIIAFIIFFDRLFVSLNRRYLSDHNVFGQYKGFAETFIHVVVWALGIFVILDSAGISITPLLASLGVGSLAVALALKDTLANFFSGIHLLADQPIEVGHFIRLESGEEGYVEKIGWRSTRIRMILNNIVIIPNSKLSGTTITNYHLPESEMSLLVQVGVHQDSDLEHVEKVTIDVAREVLKTVAGGVKDFDPVVRYHTFAESSVNFTVILRVKEFENKYLIQHEFIKRLHARYKREKIVIPFPIRTVYMAKENLLK